MVDFQCERCLKSYKFKSLYLQHKNRKNQCQITNLSKEQKDITEEQNNIEDDSEKLLNTKITKKSKFLCNYCNKSFSSKERLNYHIDKSCQIKKYQEGNKEELFARLIKEMEEKNKEGALLMKRMQQKMSTMEETMNELKRENASYKLSNNIHKSNHQNKPILDDNLTEHQNINIININNVQNVQNVQNNIQNIQNNFNKILPYGKEDLSHIAPEGWKMILKKGFKSVPALVEKVHFDKNKPENHNIYISNMQNGFVMLYDGAEWELKERDLTLQNLFEIKAEYLVEKFEELNKDLDEPTLKKFQRFQDHKDEEKTMNEGKKDIKLILYNKRKITETTKATIQIDADKEIKK